MRKIKPILRMLSAIGPGMRAGQQIDRIFRFYVLHALGRVGFFDFLNTPKSYGEILANFEFVDNRYTRDVIKTISMDKEPVILNEGDTYVKNPEVHVPTLEEVLATAPSRLHVGRHLGEGLYGNIINRLRENDMDVEGVFVRDDKHLVTSLKELLESPLYTQVRISCFDLLPRSQRIWLDGKRLLEVGCGNGIETAQLWLHTEGRVKITGIDLVPEMVESAEDGFESYLKEMDPDHPPLTEENRPHFEIGNVMQLEYEANSFDASYTMLVLHWVPDPRQAIREMIRVVKPGGLLFGAQPYKPLINPYVDLIIRSSRDSNGFFWKEDLVQWFREYGLSIELVTPAGIFRVTNTEEASKKALSEA